MKNTILQTINTHKSLVDQLEKNGINDIIAAAELIIESLNNGGCVYVCGNGGSAADAQHIAGEIVGRFLRERKALPAVALTTDTSVITAIANDYGFAEIFARQVEGLIGEGDILWGLSTSGTSENVLKAIDTAKQKGAKIIAFTGKPDSPMEKASDVCLSVDSNFSYEAQEMHQLAYHIICNLVEEHFSK